LIVANKPSCSHTVDSKSDSGSDDDASTTTLPIGEALLLSFHIYAD
jgi:hypothetical protein